MNLRRDLAGAHVRFRSSITLTKDEAFLVCQTCADAQDHLVACGRLTQASRLGDLLDLIEDRLAGSFEDPTRGQACWVVVSSRSASFPGSNSSDSEFTQ